MTGKADYTLKELVENNPIAELEQIGGPRELAGIAVRSASFQEYPPDDYIMRDELVLSTAAGCMEDTEGFIGLIALASEAGAAAIVYTIRDDGYAVPERVSR